MSGGALTRDLARRLRGRRRHARIVLWFEYLWPALWPALGVVGAFVCLALFGVVDLLPPWPHAALLVLTVAGTSLLLWRGLRRTTPPDPAAADRRLERASGLRHRPLASLADSPAATDPAGQALWRAHVARAGRELQRGLRVGVPRPGLAARDRRALRSGLVVALVASLVVAGADAPSRLGRALLPGFAPGAAPPPPSLQAWITPPGYTGLPPLFLSAGGGAVSVPAGSELTASVTGGSGEPVLGLDGVMTPFRALDAASWQAERPLDAGGRLAVRRHGRLMAAWDLTVVADAAPRAAWTEPPGARAPDAADTAPRETRLPWTASDDYGVVALEAEIRLAGRSDAAPLTVPIPLAGHPKSARGTALRDLTASPWAGLPVVARLLARDGAGQVGASEAARFTLPERVFHNPVARAVVQVRKDLTLHPEQSDQTEADLAAIADAPDAFDNDRSIYLNLSAIASLLAHGRDAAVVPEAQDRLWQLALRLEENATDRTARALAEARAAAREALEKAQNGAAAPGDLQKKLEALRAAIQRHMQALADQAKREGGHPYDPEAEHVTAGDLDRMARQAAQAAREGRMDEAEKQLGQLERMLDQLQQAMNQKQGPGQARNGEQRRRGRQQMSALQDMVQREGSLLDGTQQRSGAAAPPDDTGTMPPEPAAPPGALPEPAPGDAQRREEQQRGREARVQKALRRALGELMQEYGELTGKVPGSLGEADQAMRDAGEALAQGQDQEAGNAQRRAIQALQKGGRQMSQQMARQFGLSPRQGEGQGEDDDAGTQQEGQEQAGEGGQAQGDDGRRDSRRDPLGRISRDGTSGSDDSSDTHVPDKMEQLRTREIQDELRRRGADRTRSQRELDYINRLLQSY